MARSAYVYVVLSLSSVIGTFTVKHEMEAAIICWVTSGKNADSLTIWRRRDGGPLATFVDGERHDTAVDITNQFDWGT